MVREEKKDTIANSRLGTKNKEHLMVSTKEAYDSPLKLIMSCLDYSLTSISALFNHPLP